MVVNYFFSGTLVPSSFLCTLIFLHSCTGLLVFLSTITLPALSFLSLHTSLISAAANTGVEATKPIASATDNTIVFILFPFRFLDSQVLVVLSYRQSLW